MLQEDRNKIFAEAIDVILAIWERDAPYDIDLPDNRFKVTTRRRTWPKSARGVMYKPYQKPRPEIVGTVVAPFSKGVIAMGERDFHPLSANFLLPHWVPSHWAELRRGQGAGGQPADPADWRIARTIFVADDEKIAQRYGRATRTARTASTGPAAQAIRPIPKRHIVFKTSEPAGRPRADRRLHRRPPRHVRHRQQGRRPDTRSCARKSAISASSSTPAWTGSIRRSPSARWS